MQNITNLRKIRIFAENGALKLENVWKNHSNKLANRFLLNKLMVSNFEDQIKFKGKYIDSNRFLLLYVYLKSQKYS